MSAYVVFIRDETLDADELSTYGTLASQARGDHPITPLAFYGDLEVLEGKSAEGVVILQFPTLEAAKDWYHSPAYQAAKAHRMKGASYRVLLTQGVEAS